MNIGFVMAETRGAADLVLSQLAARLAGQGVRVAGLVQTNTDRGQDHHCDMDVQVLPAGPVFRISQVLGAGSKGCRLNPDALERAVTCVEAVLDAETDLLIINKFGKHEGEGRGFRETIARALELGVPVLMGVNGLNLAAFQDFAGDIPVQIPATVAALERWASDVCDMEQAG